MERKKILLVDDSNTILMMEKFILRNDPYELVTASNGEEAVRKAAEHRPDLILLDVIMPKMGGFEACRLIRQDAATRDIPIIMVTTRGEAANVETGWANGCNDYVTKPINAVELLAKVRSFLGVSALELLGAGSSGFLGIPRVSPSEEPEERSEELLSRKVAR